MAFMQQRILSGITIVAAAALAVGVVAGCTGSEASRGAAEGAGTGAMAGAVGGMVTALVFGGNVAEAGARGAVAGGSSGAVVGGMSGAKRDRAQAAAAADQQQEDLDQLRKDIGDDAFNGVVALAECKYPVAQANADVAMKSKNKNQALAGLWVDVLIAADQRNEAQARQKFPEIIARDRDIRDDADAEAAMRDSIQQLAKIREQFGLPAVCTA